MEPKIYCRTRPKFTDLPVEIFIQICKYLDAKFVSTVLRHVCRRFNEILDDDTLWRLFLMHQLPTYPVLPSMENLENFSWEKAYVDIEEELLRWGGNNVRCTSLLTDVHHAMINTIALIKNGTICITGSHDRSIAIWDLKQIKDSSKNSILKTAHQITNAHLWWVWRIASNSDQFYTCSMDSSIKSWDLEKLLCVETFSFSNRRSALSIACDNEVVCVGLPKGVVQLLDSKRISHLIHSYKIHSSSVLSLIMTDNYIISASEDKTIAVWDRRAGKHIKMGLKLSNTMKSIPMHMNFAAGCIFIGDHENNIFIADPIDFTIEPFFINNNDDNLVYKYKNSGIKNTFGSVITCSEDGSIHVFQPTAPCTIVNKFKSSLSTVSSLDYQSNVLAVGGDSVVEVWFPHDL